MKEVNFKYIENYNSILLGVFFSADMIIKILTVLLPVNNLLVLVYGLIIFIGIYLNRFRFSKTYISMFLIISIIFFLSAIRIENPYYTLNYYLYFCIFYLCASTIQHRFSVIVLFKFINLINFIYACYLIIYIFPQIHSETLNMDYTMDLSYTALIGVTTFILSFRFLKGKINKFFMCIFLIATIIDIYFMFFLSFNRGAMLAVIILFLFLGLRKLKNNILLMTFISLFIAVSIIIYNYTLEILIFIKNIISNWGISSRLIDKSIWQLRIDNFDSGRSDLYIKAINDFKQNPLWGTGIGYFPLNNNGAYPHNIFLEVFSSLGMLFGLFLLILLIIITMKILKSYRSEKSYFFILVYILAIPELLFSNSLWLSPFFIVLLILIFSKKNYLKV